MRVLLAQTSMERSLWDVKMSDEEVNGSSLGNAENIFSAHIFFLAVLLGPGMKISLSVCE